MHQRQCLRICGSTVVGIRAQRALCAEPFVPTKRGPRRRFRKSGACATLQPTFTSLPRLLRPACPSSVRCCRLVCDVHPPQNLPPSLPGRHSRGGQVVHGSWRKKTFGVRVSIGASSMEVPVSTTKQQAPPYLSMFVLLAQLALPAAAWLLPPMSTAHSSAAFCPKTGKGIARRLPLLSGAREESSRVPSLYAASSPSLAERHFVVLCHNVTDAMLLGDFNTNNLLEGRVDVWCRCVAAGLWISNGIRRNTHVWLMLGKSGLSLEIVGRFVSVKSCPFGHLLLVYMYVCQKGLSSVSDTIYPFSLSHLPSHFSLSTCVPV